MDGVLNIFKPVGITSFEVVRRVKRISNTKKVGHAGTLDPEASGVLPVCIGRGTKIIEYIMESTKVYRVQLKLGVITDTYDREGKIVSVKDVLVNDNTIIDTILSFKGESYQVPPMYSALKVNGKKLYELARSGVEIERTPRKINIYDIKIHSIESPLVEFEVKCSKGTYIRSLCFDIGNKLLCGGMMNNLERVATGRFEIANSIDINELTEENISNHLINMENALAVYSHVVVDDKFEKLLINGVNIMDPQLTIKIPDETLMRVYGSNNELIGLGMKSNNAFKIVKLLV
jgi:tRNA pseudouridine55 synthase